MELMRSLTEVASDLSMCISQFVLLKLCERVEETVGKTGEVPFPTLPRLENNGEEGFQ